MGKGWQARNVPVPVAYLVALTVGFGLHRARSWPLPGTHRTRCLVGLPLIAAGVHLASWSVRAAAEVDLESPDRLVSVGPYAVTRNPMYLGWTLAGLGAGVVAGTGWVLAAVPAAAVWTHREVRREERQLAGSFGAEFDRYCERVSRYLPKQTRSRRRRSSVSLTHVHVG
jgi:protein-S-isoprenylcysteine O-methyltransferase Ste14